MPTRKSYLVGLPFIHKNAVFGVIFVREGNVTALIMKVDRHISCDVYYLHSFVMKTMLFSNRKYSSIPFGE